MRKNPIDPRERALGLNLREAREAAGLSRVELAQRIEIDPARVINYEHARVVMPYHVGARIFGELDVCQRWAVTGAAPRRYFFDVMNFVETLIPRSMPFSEAYDRILAEPIQDALAKRAEEFHVAIEQLSDEQLLNLPVIGEHPLTAARRHFTVLHKLQVTRAFGGLPASKLECYAKELDALFERHFGKLTTRQLRAHPDDGETDHIKELSEFVRSRIASWKPPGHARK